MARDLINTDRSKKSELKFKTTIIRLRAGLEHNIGDTRESLTAEIKEVKSSQAEIKSATIKMQTWMDAITRRMDEAKNPWYKR